jgi:hypothetical protein
MAEIKLPNGLAITCSVRDLVELLPQFFSAESHKHMTLAVSSPVPIVKQLTILSADVNPHEAEEEKSIKAVVLHNITESTSSEPQMVPSVESVPVERIEKEAEPLASASAVAAVEAVAVDHGVVERPNNKKRTFHADDNDEVTGDKDQTSVNPNMAINNHKTSGDARYATLLLDSVHKHARFKVFEHHGRKYISAGDTIVKYGNARQKYQDLIQAGDLEMLTYIYHYPNSTKTHCGRICVFSLRLFQKLYNGFYQNSDLTRDEQRIFNCIISKKRYFDLYNHLVDKGHIESSAISQKTIDELDKVNFQIKYERKRQRVEPEVKKAQTKTTRSRGKRTFEREHAINNEQRSSSDDSADDLQGDKSPVAAAAAPPLQRNSSRTVSPLFSDLADILESGNSASVSRELSIGVNSDTIELPDLSEEAFMRDTFPSLGSNPASVEEDASAAAAVSSS